jgi:uncharacterized protein (TIGR00251 family)
MRLFIKAKPNSKKEFITKIDDTHFVIAVKAPAREGKANFAIVEKISEYFKVSFSKIKIISGRSSKEKVFEIE